MTTYDQHKQCAFWGDHRVGPCEGKIVHTDCECCGEEILCCEEHAECEEVRWYMRMFADGDIVGMLHQ